MRIQSALLVLLLLCSSTASAELPWPQQLGPYLVGESEQINRYRAVANLEFWETAWELSPWCINYPSMCPAPENMYEAPYDNVTSSHIVSLAFSKGEGDVCVKIPMDYVHWGVPISGWFSHETFPGSGVYTDSVSHDIDVDPTENEDFVTVTLPASTALVTDMDTLPQSCKDRIIEVWCTPWRGIWLEKCDPEGFYDEFCCALATEFPEAPLWWEGYPEAFAPPIDWNIAL